MKNSKHSNQVRIIGGIHRGRKLAFADAEGLRPTPDRVREQVFNWLGQDLTGKHVLDLFGGSGSTLIACEQSDRICYTVELDEKFCDVIVKRYIEQIGSSDQVSVIRDDMTYQYAEMET